MEELDQIIDKSTHAPLSESESQKLKTALHAMAERLAWIRSKVKTSAVVDQPAAVEPVEELNTGEPAPSVTGAMAPLRLPVQTEFRLRTPLHAGVSKSEIARRVQIGRTSVCRILEHGHEKTQA